jgi:Raf kinase inhibitor-like YbhB/YbcL family protein
MRTVLIGPTRNSRRPRHFPLLSLLALGFCFLVVGLTTELFAGQQAPAKTFKLESSSFAPGGDIARKFTCEGPDISPALTWTDPPAGTKTFALIADDPDAPGGTFVHWVAYNLPATARKLNQATPGNDEMSGGGRQGMNDFPLSGYGGPCPPPGKYHRYFFRLYALDTVLNLKGGATRKEVDRAMTGHILAQAEVMGRFRR